MEIREMGGLAIPYTPTDKPMRQMLELMLPVLRRTRETFFKSLEDEDQAVKYLIAAWIGLGRPEMQNIKMEPAGSILTTGPQKIAEELILKTEEALQKLKREELQ